MPNFHQLSIDPCLPQPGKRAVDLVSDGLERPLRVIAVTTRRFDGEALKKADPITYVAYLKPPSTSYTLRQVGQQ